MCRTITSFTPIVKGEWMMQTETENRAKKITGPNYEVVAYECALQSIDKFKFL